jgi:hypothetical protein
MYQRKKNTVLPTLALLASALVHEVTLFNNALKKRLAIFLSPARMSLSKLSLAKKN